MKLTVEAVAKMSGLNPSTVRQYAWERKIGKIEGRTKVFTLAEAKKLGGLKDGFKKEKRAKKTPTAKRKVKPSPKKAAPPMPKNMPPKAEPKSSVKEKKSFWSFLGFNKKPKAKVSLMETNRSK